MYFMAPNFFTSFPSIFGHPQGLFRSFNRIFKSGLRFMPHQMQTEIKDGPSQPIKKPITSTRGYSTLSTILDPVPEASKYVI